MYREYIQVSLNKDGAIVGYNISLLVWFLMKFTNLVQKKNGYVLRL